MWTVAAASAVAALFHLYAAGVSPFTALIQRPVHLALMATLGFLGVGVQRKVRREREDGSSEDGAAHSATEADHEGKQADHEDADGGDADGADEDADGATGDDTTPKTKAQPASPAV